MGVHDCVYQMRIGINKEFCKQLLFLESPKAGWELFLVFFAQPVL
jgi:hypothetical protein